MSKEKLKSIKYNIGLDIGTNSVGWAVVDQNMNLVKRCKKHLWGSRLFDERETAAERRKSRSARRRLLRRRVRIRMLDNIFAPVINDENFFVRLKESFLQKSDRTLGNVSILFDGGNDCVNFKKASDGKITCQRITCDAEYYREYPTIYHLRKEMATSPNKQYDPKLIYLAIHSIFKSRGNFLYENLFAAEDVDGPLTQVVDIAKILYGVEEDSGESVLPEWLSVLETHKDALKEILLDSKTYKSKKDKQNAIKNKISKNKTFGEFVKLILGYDVKYKSAFGSEDDKNDKTSIKLSTAADVDATISEAGEYAEFLSAAKSLYSAIEYISITHKGRKYDPKSQDKSSISDIMIDRYNRYKKQLTDLKIVFKAIYPDKAGAMNSEYRKFFRDYKEANNYARYTYSAGMCDAKKFKDKILDAIARNEKTISDAGYAKDGETVAEKAKKILLCLGGKPSVLSEVVLTDESFDAEYEAELGYLQRPRMAGNGVFPKQLHEEELNKILDNQAKYYPQLGEKRGDIIKIFNFKIDYFVGPLGAKGEKTEGFGWLKRNPGFENVNINALNYDDAIDKVATRTEFITRMVGHCTYLWEEPALPKNSMIYSYFNVLQELSNISVIINGAEAQKLNELHDLDGLNYFQVITKRLLESNTYKLKDLEHSLRRQTQYKDADIVIKGFANGEKLNSNLKPIRDMMRIFDLKINAEAYGTSDSIIGFLKSNEAIECEKIIKYITIFGESKKILVESLKEIDGLSLTEKQVNDLKALSYSGWGNLSKKLIFEFKDGFNGAEYFGKTILELMENKYKNFISVYSNERYQFEKQVKDRLKGINKPIQEQIEELACSPSVKRGIFQSFKVVQELVKVMGHAPENIFIEFAREEDDKKKGEVSKSRQKEMRKKYELAESSAKSLYAEYIKHVDCSKLEGDKQADIKSFDSERVVLYYLQAGRCMYTKEILDLNHLSDYDVDHIVPQCLIKDDSFDNKVLVKRIDNQKAKGDSEVVPEEIRQNAKPFWENLKQMGLLTKGKYIRLMRRELTESVLQGFIKRQLVETRQIIKNTAFLLSNYFEKSGAETKIRSVRAEMNSAFRREFDYPKGVGGRSINDTHHAKDAYITCLMGDYILQNYGGSNEVKPFNLMGMHYGDKKKRSDNGFVMWQMRQQKEFDKLDREKYYWLNEYWSPNDETLTVSQVLDNFDRNYYSSDCFITQKINTKTTGGFYEQTIYKNDKNAAMFAKNDEGKREGKRANYELGKLKKPLCVDGQVIECNTPVLDIARYGGYTGLNFAYFVLVEYRNLRGELIHEIVGYPYYIATRIDNNKDEVAKALKVFLKSASEANGKKEKYADFKICAFLPKKSLLCEEKLKRVYIAGKREVKIGNQLTIPRERKELNRFIYLIYKYGRSYTPTSEESNSSKQYVKYINYLAWAKNKMFLHYLEAKYPNLDMSEQVADFYTKEIENYITIQFNSFADLYCAHLDKNYTENSTPNKLKDVLRFISNEENDEFYEGIPNIKTHYCRKLLLIKELLEITKRSFGDLKLFGGVANAGAIMLPEKQNWESTYIIHTSITGIYSHKKKLIEK